MSTNRNLLSNRNRRAPPLLWPILVLCGAVSGSACSRTYDGTVVPTYQFALNHQALIPFPVLEPTPLEPPARRVTFPPPPPAVAPPPALEPPPPPSPVRAARRQRAPEPRPAEPAAHPCEQVSPPDGGRVVINCG